MAAIEQGKLDAAYLDPVAAVGAWQATHHGIRVVSGAASVGGKSKVVLTVTDGLLAAHRAWVTGLLKGQVQAMRMLVTDPAAARPVALRVLTAGRRASRLRVRRSLARARFTCDPLVESVLRQAREAAAIGTIERVGSLTAMYDLAPVDRLLRAAGFRPIGISDS